MAKKRKASNQKRNSREQTAGKANELWMAPRYSLKGPAGERAWENRPGGVPSSSKYLEMADIALGLKKPEPKKRKLGTSTHVTDKNEPYSR